MAYNIVNSKECGTTKALLTVSNIFNIFVKHLTKCLFVVVNIKFYV